MMALENSSVEGSSPGKTSLTGVGAHAEIR
jgi:hypothetical protein